MAEFKDIEKVMFRNFECDKFVTKTGTWSREVVTVVYTFVDNHNETVHTTVGKVAVNSTVAVAFEMPYGFENPTLMLDGRPFTAPTFVADKSFNFVVNVTRKFFWLSFDTNGGNGINAVKVEFEATHWLPTPTRAEDAKFTYGFARWEDANSGKVDSVTVTENTTVTARWNRKAIAAWHTLQLINNSWDTSSGAISKSNAKVRANVYTKFETGTDGEIILSGNSHLGHTARYTMNAGGSILTGSQGTYSSGSSNVYGAAFGYSLTAGNGEITFSPYANSFVDENKVFGTESNQRFSFSRAHITLYSIEQLYADTSMDGII